MSPRFSGINKRRHRALIVVAVVAGLLPIEGCYYMQAVRGQMEVLSGRQPISELIAGNPAPGTLNARLAMVQDARDFAVEALLLPDNRSYRTYRDLGRDYVVWNVIAAPEFSLEPKTWCFPVAGCVAYRGYFSQEGAQKMAAKLAADGYDVTVGGVAAYSTLGRFADPVLNTMMRWSDLQLVSTLFHELAHQKLYVKGDTAFNESFATAVASAGIERWLATQGREADTKGREARIALRRSMLSLVDATKTELEALYASGRDEDTMRHRKRELMDALSAAAAELLAADASTAENWLAPPLNNARLASLGLYEGRHDAFRAILRECDGALPCFYAAAEQLASLDKAERDDRLDEIARQAAPSPAGAASGAYSEE